MVEDPYGTTYGGPAPHRAPSQYASKPTSNVYGGRNTEPIYGQREAYERKQTHKVGKQTHKVGKQTHKVGFCIAFSRILMSTRK